MCAIFRTFIDILLKSQDQELSTLQEELAATDLYLKMQEERFGNHLMIKNNISTDKLQLRLPTLTLQILLENCIKHNVISMSKPLTVELSVSKDDILSIKNNYQPKSTQLPSTKLGLKNIQKRYGYLSDKKVEIKANEEAFKVSVPLLN